MRLSWRISFSRYKLKWRHQLENSVLFIQAMLMPNAKPGSIFFLTHSTLSLFSTANPTHALSSLNFEAILYGVELLLISISHNNNSLLENMSRLSTLAFKQDITALASVTCRYLITIPLFYFLALRLHRIRCPRLMNGMVARGHRDSKFNR